ncbi:Protein fluG [Linum perenne]
MEFKELREAIEKVQLVDGHAHNIVALNSSFPFVNGFSEATGDASTFAPHSLSFKRNLREIAELYGCGNSLQEVEEHRRSSGLESVASACFKATGISAVLIDDGLKLHNMHKIDWHKSYFPFVGRILRIERFAEEILEQEGPYGATWTLDTFTAAFVERLKSTVAKDIVGLKSIAAYRSGLEINPKVTSKDAAKGLAEVVHSGNPVRLVNKSLIDYIFVRSLEVALTFDLPMQIHTGFGDKDLDLRLANPLHLRAVLEDERFSKCRLVILHASYPFSREASHLASVYSQVYLDFGLAVPKLSVHGMISSVKELLELAPIKKVMFSTDGYAFPETYYLGAKKARECLFSVLQDACRDGDLTVAEAVEAARDILAQNAIRLYKINVDADSILSREIVSNSSLNFNDRASETGISFVRVIWVDTSGQHRCRAIPAKRFNDVVKRNGVGLTFACMGMPSYIDAPADGSNLTGTGEIRLMPDLSTKRKIPWMEKEEMVLADMHLKPGQPWEYCPREALRRVSKVLKDEFDLVMNAGFENEFVILKSISRDGREEWTPFESTAYCSAAGFDAASPILHDIVAALDSLNIPVEQLHKEAGKGQLEIALGHSACLTSADNLVYAREAIRSVARKRGFMATFMPKYALDDIGSGSHVHISLSRNGENVFTGTEASSSQHGMSRLGSEFMSGVLHHLPSVLAFTAPVPNSYDRIQPNTWSGAYQCWGKENREAPLRTACPPGITDGLVSNFEIKSFDACANPHLGLAAIIAAGIDGLRRHLELPEPVELHLCLQAEIEHYSKNKEAYKQMIFRY